MQPGQRRRVHAGLAAPGLNLCGRDQIRCLGARQRSSTSWPSRYKVKMQENEKTHHGTHVAFVFGQDCVAKGTCRRHLGAAYRHEFRSWNTHAPIKCPARRIMLKQHHRSIVVGFYVIDVVQLWAQRRSNITDLINSHKGARLFLAKPPAQGRLPSQPAAILADGDCMPEQAVVAASLAPRSASDY